MFRGICPRIVAAPAFSAAAHTGIHRGVRAAVPVILRNSRHSVAAHDAAATAAIGGGRVELRDDGVVRVVGVLTAVAAGSCQVRQRNQRRFLSSTKIKELQIRYKS